MSMLPEIVEYSGYLMFGPLSDEQTETARSVLTKAGHSPDLEPHALEFEYSGRDTNRKVVRLLGRLAEIIGDADGEIVCTIEREGADPDFEFYSIRDGRLLRQRGRIVREASAEVVEPAEVSQVA
jgi:hypothetical protein